MAQELRIDTWCDPCLAAGANEEGAPEEVTMGGKARVLDLCKAHRDKLLGPLETALEAWGRRPEGAPAKRAYTRRAPTPQPAEARSHSARVPVAAMCLVCGHQSPTSSALGAHIKTAHGLTMADMFGTTCPMCGTQLSATGMGMHLTKSHGIKGGMAAAFNEARAAGDAHGVVATQDAWAGQFK